MTSIQPYKVPILSGDLRRAELIKQFADVLDYLDAVSQDMFNRIAIRLNVYRAQLNKFDERIQHANAHIDRIKGSKRAIQVHSSARYPVEQGRSKYQSIFECDNDNEEHKTPVLHYNPFHLNETTEKFFDGNDKESKSNDSTLIVLKQYQDNFIQKTNTKLLNGLGRPPTNIKSVVSFLKYNTQENPYTQPTKIDPLSVDIRKRKRTDEPVKPHIGETPMPAFYKQISERPTTGDFAYNPTLGAVPQMSLPDNLPDLDNYATFEDNTVIDWTRQQMPSIAPSFAMSILPDVNELSTTSAPPPPEPPKPTIPAPPPVDMPAIIPLTSVSNTTPPPPPPMPSVAPPLPPSVPSVLSPPPDITEVQTPAKTNVADDENTDDFDTNKSLLAQIRSFGKNKLKPISKSNPVDDTPTAYPEETNIMDQLKLRLGQRRRLLMGGDGASSSTGTSSADKNLPIPQPPPSTGGSLTDAIASKMKAIVEEKQRQKNASDNDNNDDDDDKDWE